MDFCSRLEAETAWLLEYMLALTEEALTARRPHLTCALKPAGRRSYQDLPQQRLRRTATTLHLFTLSQTYTFLTAVSN